MSKPRFINRELKQVCAAVDRRCVACSRSSGMAVTALLTLLSWSTVADGDASSRQSGNGTLYGVWEVTEVLVNLSEPLRWTYPPDDPLRVGRRLTIDRQGLRLDYPKLDCKQTAWSQRSTTWRAIFAQSFPKTIDGSEQSVTTPADFDLPVKVSDSLRVWPVCPTRRGHYLQGVWLTLLKDGRLALHMDPAGLLVFERRPRDLKPEASFPCAEAKSAAERTICGDVDLAAWDRSVAAAYEYVQPRVMDPGALIDSQRAWLKERDACGADKSCLEEQMIGRANSLMFTP